MLICSTQRSMIYSLNVLRSHTLCNFRQLAKPTTVVRWFATNQQTESNKKSNATSKEVNATFTRNDPRMTPRERLKGILAVYGPTGIVLHIVLSLSFLGLTYLVIRFGLDAPALLVKYGYNNEKYMMIIANGGTFGLSYAIYKAAMPIRVPFTIVLTPIVARTLQRYGIIKRSS